MITLNYYDTVTLLGVLQELEPVSNYWLNLLFGRTVNSDDEFIDFEKLDETRKIAPFVVPGAQGQPIFNERSRVRRFKPAYLKPKDPIQPTRMLKRIPGEMLLPTPLSPQDRMDRMVVETMRQHRDSIERRMEWMAAKAILDGQVVIAGENYPTQTVNFGRDAANSVTLGAGTYWSEATVNPLENIEAWRTIVHDAKFGGTINRITFGTAAWDAFRKNPFVKDELDTNFRGTAATFQKYGDGGEVEFRGYVSGDLELWVYRDYYESDNGTIVEFMDKRDVLLSGPNVNGVRAFGAIMDDQAEFAPVPIYPSMWRENDPPLVYVMAQSAPLMVPMNPNNTLKARVVA